MNAKARAWIRAHGVARLAVALGRRVYGQPLTAPAVSAWLSGRTVPRPTHAIALVELSEGKLTLADVYSPSTPETAAERHQEPQYGREQRREPHRG